MIARARVCVRLSLLVGCLGAEASAQQLTERHALELLRESPHYRELQARVEVTRAETRRGTLYPNPSTNASFEGAGRTDFYLIEQPLALNGRLRLLRQAGAAAVAAAEAEADHELRQLEARVRGAFFRLSYAQERKRTIRNSIEELQEVVRILREREKEGAGSKFDRLRAEREVVERETEAGDTEAFIAEYRAELARFLGERFNLEGLTVQGTLAPQYPLPELGDMLASALGGAQRLSSRERAAGTATARNGGSGSSAHPEPGRFWWLQAGRNRRSYRKWSGFLCLDRSAALQQGPSRKAACGSRVGPNSRPPSGSRKPNSGGSPGGL